MPQTPVSENDFLFLLFAEGMVPVRVGTVNRVIYDYNPVNEIQSFTPLAVGEFRNIGVLASTLLNSKDLLLYSQPDLLLHVSFGISPSSVKIFQEYPKGKKLRTFGVNIWSESDTEFGGISGRTSPLFDPAEEDGLMLLPQTEPSFTFLNTDTIPVSPILRLDIRFFTFDYIVDAEYTMNQLNNIYPKRAISFSLGPAESPLELARNIPNMKKGNYLLVPYSTSTPSDIVSKTNGVS